MNMNAGRLASFLIITKSGKQKVWFIVINYQNNLVMFSILMPNLIPFMDLLIPFCKTTKKIKMNLQNEGW